MGLMSGTSMDGIDVALLETDGQTFTHPRAHGFYPYDPAFRAQLSRLLGTPTRTPLVQAAEHALTLKHSAAVKDFLTQHHVTADQIDVIGFHGQALYHNPKGMAADTAIPWETLQIGDGALLARETGIAVVNDLRRKDVLLGGQGAPLVPIYHQVLAQQLPKPVVFLNIGGVANITWIGPGGRLLAYDVGPGNALLDDWVHLHTGASCDKDGALGASGKIHHPYIDTFLTHPFFKRIPPKSLDRQTFQHPFQKGALGLEDGAATLTAMIVAGIAAAQTHFPVVAPTWYVMGGGRHNPTLMHGLAKALAPAVVQSIEELDYQGDFIEAEAFAYLAVRSLLGLPYSFPETTGVPTPCCGGVYYAP